MGLQNLRWLSNWIHRSRKLGYWESCLGKKIVLLKTYFWIILFTDFNLISTVQAWTNRYKKSTIHWLLVVKYFTNITYDPVWNSLKDCFYAHLLQMKKDVLSKSDLSNAKRRKWFSGGLNLSLSVQSTIFTGATLTMSFLLVLTYKPNS